MLGRCLCGGVEFVLQEALGPFELCHCRRCQKASGSAYAAFLTAKVEGYSVVRGADLISTYDAPLINGPPAYTVWFCSKCGSPVPNPAPEGDIFEIPAGAVDDAVPHAPDKHIFVDLRASWEPMADHPSPFTKEEIRAFRAKHGRVAILPSDEPIADSWD